MPHVGVEPGLALWTFRDDRGRTIALPSEDQANALARSKDGSSSRQVARTTFGELVGREPRALIQTHGQYYWAEDLA
jgi:hypothetical protein